MPEVISHGSDRDPRRPSRGLVVIAGVLVVLAVASVLVTRLLDHRRDAREAEAVAARHVAFDVEDLLDGRWRLSNLSATALTVESVVLDFPHQDLISGRQALSAHGFLSLLNPPTCDEGLYDKGPSSVMVQAVTRKGSRVTRRVALDKATAAGAWDGLKHACRLVGPADAFVGEILTATWNGGTVRLVYEVNNVGARPLTVEGISYEPGVTVTVLPQSLVLRPGAESAPGTGTASPGGPFERLVVELRVSSCGPLEAAVRHSAGADGRDGWGTLKARVRNFQRPGEGILDLGSHAERLLRSCPGIARYLDTGQ